MTRIQTLPSAASLEPLREARTILLETFRRDGTPAATPVSIAFSGERAFFRTWDAAWKARRLRRDPNVTATPCSFVRGRPIGPAVEARARRLDGAEAEAAARALARRHPVLHGVLVPLTHRLMRYRTVHYELTA